MVRIFPCIPRRRVVAAVAVATLLLAVGLWGAYRSGAWPTARTETVLAWYSTTHLPPGRLAQAFAEFIIREIQEWFEVTMHAIMNVHMELDGDKAYTEAAVPDAAYPLPLVIDREG